MTVSANYQTPESLSSSPFPCANCDEPIPSGVLFCSELCNQEAEWVRYCRACIVDGRFKRADVQEAIRIKLAHILSGGYPRSLRRVPEALRAAVIERDQGLCRKCGGPANTIDHIRGSHNTLENLQLLCVKCHNEKTTARFIRITPESHPEEWKKRQSLLARVRARNATRLCDSSDWQVSWRDIRKARREAVKVQAAGASRKKGRELLCRKPAPALLRLQLRSV
jgi:5-methylcytosine-specific restriction endonuclease McrA